MKKPLVLAPGLHEPAIVANVYRSNTQKVEAGGSGSQDHPRLHREWEVSLGYM